MLRDLLTQIWCTKLVLDIPEHVESENVNLKIGYRPYLYQLFSKRDFHFIKCGENWWKMTKNWFFWFFWKISFFECYRSKTVSDVFRGLKNVEKAEKSLKIGQILSQF
jgi:hypothetical protein